MPPNNTKNIYNKSYRWEDDERTVFSAGNANGVGSNVDTSQHRHVGFTIFATGSPNLTVKAVGSHLYTSDIDFSLSSSDGNTWGYQGMWRYDTGSHVDGSTGIAITSETTINGFINSETLKTVNFEISGYSAGSVYIKIYAVNNQ